MENEKKDSWFMIEVCDVVADYAIPTAFSKYASYMSIPLGKPVVRSDRNPKI
jgi:hypothetical protein